MALRADDSEGEFDDNDETFTMAAKPTEVPAVPLDYDEESGDEDNDKEMDEEEELLALQQLENLEESDQENAVNEATGLDDSDENEEGEVTRIDVELPNEDARDDIDNTPPGDSQSDTPTQGDAVGGDEENRTTTEDSVQVEIKESATSKSKAKAKNSIYAQLLLEEERQAKQQVTVREFIRLIVDRNPSNQDFLKLKPKKMKKRVDKRVLVISALSFKKIMRTRKRFANEDMLCSR